MKSRTAAYIFLSREVDAAPRIVIDMYLFGDGYEYNRTGSCGGYDADEDDLESPLLPQLIHRIIMMRTLIVLLWLQSLLCQPMN